MRIWTVTKRTLVTIFFIFLAVGILLGTAFGKAKSTSAKNRLLPIYAVSTPSSNIAVTFDVAWGNEDIDKILAVLKKHNAKATFFIVGEWASKFPEDVKKMSAEGHSVGNHSDTHKSFSKCSKSQIKKELLSCNEKLEGLTSKKVTLARAPSGDYTNDSISIASQMSMTMIQWNIDSLDYRGLSVNEIVNRVVPAVSNGSILLFHTGVENTAPALDLCLTKLSEKGFNFITVDELIYKDNFTIDHTGRQKPQNENSTLN